MNVNTSIAEQIDKLIELFLFCKKTDRLTERYMDRQACGRYNVMVGVYTRWPFMSKAKLSGQKIGPENNSFYPLNNSIVFIEVIMGPFHTGN